MLTPAFTPDVSTYVADLTQKDWQYRYPFLSEAAISASPQSESATVSINGVTIDSTEPYLVGLDTGQPTLIDVAVTAESGRTQHYTVAVGATGELPECPNSCSSCEQSSHPPQVDVTLLEASPANAVLTAGVSTSFVFEISASFVHDPPEQVVVDVSLDSEFGSVTIDEPAPVFHEFYETQLVTVTVEPTGKVADGTLNVSARPCSGLHRRSPLNPIELTLGELPQEPRFYVNDTAFNAEGFRVFPADVLPWDLAGLAADLINWSSVEQVFSVSVYLELDSGSLDDWNWSGLPTPFPPTRTLGPSTDRHVSIPLTWTSDGTPPVGTTGRLISTATIEGTSTSNTLVFPFVVGEPAYACQ